MSPHDDYLRIELTETISATSKDIYYEDDGANVTDLPGCLGIRIGSIVEGSDVEIDPVQLLFPFTDDDLDSAVKDIDSEASFYWDRDNSTFYSVRDKAGKMILYAQWRQFDDGPIVEDKRRTPLAKKAYAVLFPPELNVIPMEYGKDKPIPGTKYYARLEVTPDMVF